MAMYGAEMSVQVDDGPTSRFAVAVTAPTEDAARKQLLREHLDAFERSHPDRKSLDIRIVSIGRVDDGQG